LHCTHVLSCPFCIFGCAACQRWDATTNEIENGVFLGRFAALTFKGPYAMDGKVGGSVGQARKERHMPVKHASTYTHSLLTDQLLHRYCLSTGQCCSFLASLALVDALAPAHHPNTDTQSQFILPTHPPSLQILAFDFDTLKLRLGGWTPSFGLKAKIEPRWAACLPACLLAG
jgi:hypothetical protein